MLFAGRVARPPVVVLRLKEAPCRPPAVLHQPGAALLLKRVEKRPTITPDAAPLPNDLTTRQQAIADLLALSEAMASEGRTLIERVLPRPPDIYTQWTHYPQGDAIDASSSARWFYHAHPPDQRGPREHGHFHLFLPQCAFGDQPPLAAPVKVNAAKVVHVAALCFDIDGLPTHWIAPNQWVTEEYLYPAAAIIERLDQVRLEGAGEAQAMADIGRWLGLALRIARDHVTELLLARDVALAKTTPQDRAAEVLAQTPFAL